MAGLTKSFIMLKDWRTLCDKIGFPLSPQTWMGRTVLTWVLLFTSSSLIEIVA